jgi:hypothetical protein
LPARWIADIDELIGLKDNGLNVGRSRIQPIVVVATPVLRLPNTTTDHDGSISTGAEPWLHVQGSRHFLDWLAGVRISLAFSTYQTGKVFFVGRKPDASLSVFERTFNHCMGLWASPDGRTMWLVAKFQVWRFEQAAAAVIPYRPATAEGDDAGIPAWAERGYDVAYVPRIGYTTGNLKHRRTPTATTSML